MKSFLVRNKVPIIKWTHLPDNIYYEGEIPEGFDLAVCPSEGYIVVDIDRHGDKNGFDHVPEELEWELYSTLSYPTKNKGLHCWFKYTGNVNLANKPSGIGIDLRTSRGYVVFYPRDDFRKHIHEIKESSEEMNEWLEMLFYGKSLNRKK